MNTGNIWTLVHSVPKQLRNVLRINQPLEETFHSVGFNGVYRCLTENLVLSQLCKTVLITSINMLKGFFHICTTSIVWNRDTWAPVTKTWRVLRLWMEERPPIWRVAANIFNNSRGRPTRGGPPASRLGQALPTHRKNVSCYELFTKNASDLD
jgi:hypothetical protein